MKDLLTIGICVTLWILYFFARNWNKKRSVEKTARLVSLWIRVPLLCVYLVFLCLCFSFIKSGISDISAKLAIWGNNEKVDVFYPLFSAVLYGLYAFPAFNIIKIICSVKTLKPMMGSVRHFIGGSALCGLASIICFLFSFNQELYRHERENCALVGSLGFIILLLSWGGYGIVKKKTDFFHDLHDKVLYSFSKENYYKTCILVFGFIISVCMILIALKVCL